MSSGRPEGGSDDQPTPVQKSDLFVGAMKRGNAHEEQGRDGLRRTGHRQLSFVLADSPDGGGSEGPPDASEGRAFLLQRAKRKRSARAVAWAADASRLLEEVASEANLALALLNVVRNEGAPGIDGQTVEEAEADAPRLLPRLRRALLEGRYRPGDVRRVFHSEARRRAAGPGHPDAGFIMHLAQFGFGKMR